LKTNIFTFLIFRNYIKNMSQVIPQQQNFTAEVASLPAYKMTRYQPSDGQGATRTLTTSESDIVFSLPNDVYNLGKSWIEFDFLIAAQGALAVHAHASKPPFTQIRMSSQSDFTYAQIQSVDTYYKAVSRVNQKGSEFRGKNPLITGASVGASLTMTDYLTPAKVSGNTAQTAHASTSNYVFSDGTVSNFAGIAPTIAQGNLDFDGHQQVVSSATSGALGFSAKIPLKNFVHTMIAQDKNVYFNDITNLTFTLAPLSRVGFASTNIADPATGGVALTTATMTNIYLYLAIEKNQDNVEALKKKYASGHLKYTLPFVVQFNNPLGSTAGNTSAQCQLSKAHGNSLLRTYYVAQLTSNVDRLSVNLDNVAGVKISALQSSIDGSPLTDRAVQIGSGQDWKYLSQYLQESAVSNERIAKTCGILWVDPICGASEPSWRWAELDTLQSGLSLLAQPTLVSIDLTKTAVGTTLHTFCIVQRMLSLSPSGPAWVSA
jgi:hypothetical protein